MKKDRVSSYSLNTAHRHPTDRCPGFVTDLILRCAVGDEAALGSLFDHLYPLVIAIVGGAAPLESDEARVLATFRRLWDQAPNYDPKLFGSVEWVVSQARHVVGGSLPTDVPDAPAVLTR